jgi:hypothetical protein
LALSNEVAVNHMLQGYVVPVFVAPGFLSVGLRQFTRQQLPGRTTGN